MAAGKDGEGPAAVRAERCEVRRTASVNDYLVQARVPAGRVCVRACVCVSVCACACARIYVRAHAGVRRVCAYELRSEPSLFTIVHARRIRSVSLPPLTRKSLARPHILYLTIMLYSTMFAPQGFSPA